MKASVITVGDELLIGQVVNTNASWIGERLTDAGIDVVAMHTVGDDAQSISRALEQALITSELILVTGGLGPTHDDITRDVIADFFQRQLRFDPDLFAQVRARFEKRGLKMAESNRSQAMVPEDFEVLPNPLGTASGLLFRLPDSDPAGTLVVLPGVPYEMKRLVDREVLPRLSVSGERGQIVTRTILTTGLGESTLQERLDSLGTYIDEALKLSYLPGIQGVRLRLSAYTARDSEAEARLGRLAEHIYEQIGDHIYGEGEVTLESVVGRLLDGRGLSLAVAESCTGGLIMSLLTDVPGASNYLLGGVTAYENSVKTDVLGVKGATIESEGAVSRSVAIEMAEGVRTLSGADVAISTTGIMGPGGGTEEKPVGTVWIGYTDESGSMAVRLHLGNDRSRNKARTATAALNTIRTQLGKRDRSS